MVKDSIVIFLSFIVITGCSRANLIDDSIEDNEVGYIVVNTVPVTKTSISGRQLSWTKGDQIGLYMGSVQQNCWMTNTYQTDVSRFEGTYMKIGVESKEITFKAYYPYQQNVSTSTVTATLPSVQSAPFDASANFMYSESVTALYNEDDMPSLSMEFSQLMGLVKVSVTNTSSSLASRSIKSVSLTEGGRALTGDFSFDIWDPTGTLSFSGNTYTTVEGRFAEGAYPMLTVGNTSEVYLFIAPGTLSGITLTVAMDDGSYVTFETESEFNVTAGNVTNLPVVDISSKIPETSRTVACWGDSYMSNVSTLLQGYLGLEWTTIDGHCSGDKTTEVAARQGGLQLETGDNTYSVPSSSSLTVPFNGFYTVRDEANQENCWKLRDGRPKGPLMNPCMVCGILCNVTSSSIQRLSDGEAFDIPAHTPIYTYAARELRGVDLTVIYMSGNGGYSKDADVLISQHNDMINFVTNSSDYIVLANHSSVYSYVSGYETKLATEFGERLVNLRTEVCNRAVELLLRTNAYDSESSIPQSELDRAASGQWPVIFMKSASDDHPSLYGQRAIALLIYEQMDKLGYI